MVYWLTRSLLILAVIILVGIAYALSSTRPFPEAATIGSEVQSFKELSSRFTKLAEEKGASYAFEILRRAPLPPQTDMHLLGHEVGDVLYEQKGVEGIADCTQEFRNACSHSIVIGALNEFGTSNTTLEMIDDACKKAPGGLGAYTMCYHGLGHGVFAYFGYDLSETVTMCKRMGTSEYHDEQYTQCVSGAVMELMGGGGHDRDRWLAARERYLTSDDPLSPCMSALIPEQARIFCLIYITPRLFEFAGAELAKPDPSFFPKAFGYCDALPKSKQDLRDACFGGFGKEFIPLVAARDTRGVDRLGNDAYARAIEWCELAGADDGKDACIGQEVESLFWGGENDPAASFRFCSLVPPARAEACYQRIAVDIQRYLRGADKSLWCGKLPESYRSICANTSAPNDL